MTISCGAIVFYIQTSLSTNKQPDENGFYIYTKKEICEHTDISSTTFQNSINEAIQTLKSEARGWLSNSNESICMISDISYKNGILKFKRNPNTMIPELEYYWAVHPVTNWFAHISYDENHIRRYNGSEARYGTFPWSWSDEEIAKELAKSSDV